MVGYSQSDTTKKENHKLIIGVHGGLAGAVWWGDRKFRKQVGFNYRYQPIIGFSTGPSFQYSIFNKISLFWELNYDRIGSTILQPHYTGNSRNGGDLGTFESDIFYDYISIPLMVKFKINKKMGVYVNIGCYLSYLINFNSFAYYPSNDRPASYFHFESYYHYEDVKRHIDQLPRFDCGLITGLGWDIPIKKRLQFSIEVRNNLGVLLNYKKNENYIANPNRYNESFALLFGLAYKI